MNPTQTVQDITLHPQNPTTKNVRVVGKGFAVNRTLVACIPNGETHSFEEQWMITLSDAHAKRQIQSFIARMEKAINKVSNLKPQDR